MRKPGFSRLTRSVMQTTPLGFVQDFFQEGLTLPQSEPLHILSSCHVQVSSRKSLQDPQSPNFAVAGAH